MATISLSSTTIDNMDKDNIRVLFKFLTSVGEVVVDGHRVVPRTADLNALASVVGAILLTSRKNKELYDCIFNFAWDYILKYSTNLELAAFIRGLYLVSDRDTLAQIASRILEWIVNGRFTDAQVANAFNLTTVQWNTLKTKMQNLVNSYTTVETAVGE